MPLTPLSSGKSNLSHRMDCKEGCELAEEYNHAPRVGKYCFFGALMLLLEGQTEAGLFPMSKCTFFMN